MENPSQPSFDGLHLPNKISIPLGQDDGSFSPSTRRQPDSLKDDNLPLSIPSIEPSIIRNSDDSEAGPAQALHEKNARDGGAIYKVEK